MKTAAQHIAVAFERSGLKVTELLAKSGLPLDRSSLTRKIKGQQGLDLAQAAALAKALAIKVPGLDEALALANQLEIRLDALGIAVAFMSSDKAA